MHIKTLLAELLAHVEVDVKMLPSVPMPRLTPYFPQDDEDDKSITQAWVWSRIARFLQPGDVVFGETGTAAFGLPDTTFPRNVR